MENEYYQEGYYEGYDAGYQDREAIAHHDGDAAHQEGYDEGYAEGQREAMEAQGGAFKAIHAWLEERGVLKWDEHPDGLNTETLMDLIYEHERALVTAAKRSVMQ